MGKLPPHFHRSSSTLFRPSIRYGKKALTDKQLSSDTPWIIQDKRFTSLASNIKTGEENTGIRIVKYPLYPSGDVGLMANNLVVLRLTEVYYTLAEVSFRLGNPAKAEAILNQIRKRYYAPEDWNKYAIRKMAPSLPHRNYWMNGDVNF